jgi:hypothetical protein
MNEAEKLRQEAAQHETDAAESFERCDTDGFVSQWASGLSAQKARVQADIVEAGGVATFGVYELQTTEGEPVAAKLIRGKYGPCWALQDETGEFTGTFIGAHPVRESTLAKKGYREVVREFVAPAVADFKGHGTGLASAHTVHVVVRPAETGVKWDLEVGLGDQTEEA